MANSKAREATTLPDLIFKFNNELQLLHAMIRDIKGFSSTETKPIGTATGITGAGITGLLKTEGAPMIGPLAFNPVIALIDQEDNSINLSRDFNESYSSRVIVSASGGATKLDYIHGAAFAGQLLDLQGILSETFDIRPPLPLAIINIVGTASSNIITVDVADTSALLTGEYLKVIGTTNYNIDHTKITILNATQFTFDIGFQGSLVAESTGTATRGNIRTFDGNNFTVTDNDNYWLVFDSISNEWNTFVVGSSGGGGSFSEPVELGFNEVVTQTPPTKTIVAGNMFNPSHINLDQDIELQLNTSATASKYKSIFIIFDTTGGGFTVNWPVSVIDPPIINDTVAQRISVILYTLNNGILWTHATSVGSSSGGGEFFGPWTANHNAGLQDLTNVANIDFNDTLSTIFGLVDLQWFQAGHQFTSVSGQFNYRVDTLDKHVFHGGANPILEIDDITGLKMLGSHVINMGNNSINSINELQFSNSNLHTPSNELSIAFDAGDNALKYSVPLTTDLHMFFADTDLLASISRIGVNEGQLSIEAVVSNILQTNDQVFFADATSDPTINGQFRRNGVDVKVFTGSSLVNLSDVGSPQSSIVDGNSSATILDAAPTFVVVLDGVQKYSISNTRVDYEELDLFGITQINMNDSGANLISVLNASVSGLELNIISTSNMYDIKFNSVDAFHIDNLRTRILSTTPNTTDPKLSLFRDDPSPTIGDELGVIKFEGNNSAAVLTTYGEVSTTIGSLTNGAEYANFFVNLKQNGFDVDMLRIVNGVMILRTFNSVSDEGAIFDLLKEDASPGNDDLIAKVRYSVLDGPEIIYSETRAEIEDATDAGKYFISTRADGDLRDVISIVGRAGTPKADITFLDETILKAASGGVIGIFINDAPGALDSSGSLGTLQGPVSSDNNNPPSINDLDSLFGDFIGAHGMYGLGTARSLYWKTELGGGEWARFQVTSYIIV